MAGTSNPQRRLNFVEDIQHFGNENAPSFEGWEIIDTNGERLGRVDALIGDKQHQQLRYIDIQLDSNEEPGQKSRASLPVGLLELDLESQRLVAKEIDKYVVKNGPVHEPGHLISYEEEMRIRAYYEEPVRIYSKEGISQPGGEKPRIDRQGEAINEQLTDPKDAYKRDKELNEGRVADELQGQYTPNLQGDPRGIRKSGINAEGKHDIKATSGNPESPHEGSADENPEIAPKPAGSEAFTTDNPGATLGQSEVDNKYREPRNQELPGKTGKPESPLNANDDFYRHEMFDEGRFLKS